MKDYYAKADDMMKKLEWVSRATAKNVTLHISPDEHVENANKRREYETDQFTLHQFRSLIAVHLSNAFRDGQLDVQQKMKEALGIRDR